MRIKLPRHQPLYQGSGSHGYSSLPGLVFLFCPVKSSPLLLLSTHKCLMWDGGFEIYTTFSHPNSRHTLVLVQ